MNELVITECVRGTVGIFSRQDCREVQSNDTHRVPARLEAAGRLSGVITQNIDGLHQKAGSKRTGDPAK